MKTIILALAIVTAAIGNEAESRARAALVLSVSVTKRVEDKKCPLGVPNCACGCRDGNTCVCARVKASKKCYCTNACECGCVYGKQCQCPVVIGVPSAAVAQPMLQHQLVQPQPFVNYPVTMPIRNDHIPMPVGPQGDC